MAANATSTPIYPFENPGHALILIGVGLFFWTIGTTIRAVALHPKVVRELTRHDPWYFLFKGRPNTTDEQEAMLPDGFFSLYGIFGFGAVVIGYMVGAWGLLGLCVSLAKKLL